MKKYQGQIMKARNMSQEIGEEYASSLSDLTMNSKPLINMLTILAEENILYAPVIVQVVQNHLTKIDTTLKLPVMYLVDSIIKNVGGAYKDLFTHCIVDMFCSVFASVDERIRTQMYKLRQTWIDIFPSVLLYSLDVKVNGMDFAWPITAHATKCNSIHVNPNFLKKSEEGTSSIKRNTNAVEFIAKASDNSDIRSQIISKQRELLQLEKKKLELQLEATKRKLEEQQMELKNKKFLHPKLQTKPSLDQTCLLNITKTHQEIPGLNNHDTQPKIKTCRDPRLNRIHEEADKSHVSTTSTCSLLQTETSSHNLADKSLTEKVQSNKLTSESMNLDFDADKIKPNEVQNISKRSDSKDVDLRILVPQPLKHFCVNSPKRSGQYININKENNHCQSEMNPKPQIASIGKYTLEGNKDESRKKCKLDTLGDLFGAEDVDQRKLSEGGKTTRLSTDQENSMEISTFITAGSQSKTTKIIENNSMLSPKENIASVCNLEVVRAKLAEATKNTNFGEEYTHALSSNIFSKVMQGAAKENLTVSNKCLSMDSNNGYFKASPMTNFANELKNLSPISDDDFRMEQENFQQTRSQTSVSKGKYEFSLNARICRKRSREIMDVTNLNACSELQIGAPISLTDSLQKADTQSSDEFWQRHEERNRKQNSQSEAPCLGIVPLTEPWRSLNSSKRDSLHESDNVKRFLDDTFLQEIQSFESMKPVELPLANPWIIDFINKDMVRIIHIDGIPRDIRFYNETAVTLMNWRDAHEIRFYDGERRITFDGIRSYILRLNQSYMNVLIHGMEHKIKLGSPTRELYIDGVCYECFFGGPPITIPINGRPTMVQLDGPIPQVKIGGNRNDLVAGKVNVIVDASVTCTLYLDPKSQKVELSDCVLVIRFADALQTVYINEVPFETDFGGPPKHIVVQKVRHFVRFAELPEHIKPGYIRIKNMPNTKRRNNTFPISYYNNIPPSYKTHSTATSYRITKETRHMMQESTNTSTTKSVDEILELLTRNAPNLKQSTDSEISNWSDISMDVDGVFQKVNGTDIFKEEKDKHISFPYIEKKDEFPNFSRPQTLLIRNNVLIEKMHKGIQCATCGLRFIAEQTLSYSQHLDWHFTQKKQARRKAKQNPWNCTLSEWIHYDEDGIATRLGSCLKNNDEIVITTNVIPSLAAEKDSSNTCNGCQEKFDQFYNEDKEQWELRNALKIKGLLYHPICFTGENSSGLYNSENEMLNLKIKIEVDESIDSSKSNTLRDNTAFDYFKNKSPAGVCEDDEVTIEEPIVEVVNIQDDEILQNMETKKDTNIGVTIKEEPMDFDEDGDDDFINVIINDQPPDNTRTTVISSIDGNDELEPADHERITNLNKIVVNLTNSVSVAQSGEPEYKVKESLMGVVFDVRNPVDIGTEISGFCSIM